MSAAAPPPPATAPEVDDEQGPVVWYHEGPPELTTARYWIADYSISKYSAAAQVSLVFCILIVLFFNLRAQARLQKAREEAQRPGPEKAARIQNLHKKLRVCISM